MKSTLTVFIVLTFMSFSFGQNVLSNEQLVEVFSEIHKTDGSYVHESEKRELIFQKNFDKIIEIIRTQGFPVSMSKKQVKKSHIFVATRMTFIHILQTDPTKLLNNDVITLIQKEVDEHRLDRSLLKDALKVFKYDHSVGRSDNQWNPEIEKYFNLALNEWDIHLDEKSKAMLVKHGFCE